MATWPSTLPPPQKNISIIPGDTRIARKLQSGRTEFRRFGDGKPDQVKVLFHLTWPQWDIFKEFHAHDLNLGINWFSADWLVDLGYDAHKAKILGYPREVALQNFYVDVLCILIIQATTDIAIEDTVWPCEPTGAEPEPPPPDVDGYIYGGYSGGYLLDCDKYVVSTDVWTGRADIPLPARSYLSAASLATSSYITAGGTPGTLRDCDEYTPNAWINKTDMPLPARYLVASVGIGGVVHSFGSNTFPSYNDCDAFTALTNSWAALTNISPGRNSVRGSAINNKSYVYAGNNPYSASVLCDEHDPNLDAWTSKTNLPLPARSWPAASTIGSAGYVYGGGSALQDCDEYLAVGDVWSSKNDLLGNRSNCAASTISSAGYVYGSLLSSGVCDKFLANAWTSKTAPPAPIRHSLAASSL